MLDREKAMHIQGDTFIDEHGRQLLLRGVNLGGSSKVPYRPDGSTYRREGFFDHRNVSFVGRPFPLEEADEHFSRLRRWGFTLLRFLVTWEAIEYAGPGEYDTEYLDYIEEVVRRAGEYGFSVFINPHQDVWSRFTGGDGAPGWTLEAAGLEMTRFTKNGAAVVHSQVGDPLPRMIWATNAAKLACSTMFTLFFGGNDFAPQLQVDGQPIQDYLQNHYIQAVSQVAMRLKDMPHVIGYDTLNEPSAGYIGIQDLDKFPLRVRWGYCPTPYEGMVLGDGNPLQVDTWKIGLTGFVRTGKPLLNQERESAWSDGRGCIWRKHGVWDYNQAGKPVLLQPDYFALQNGQPVNFAQQYLRPFIDKFTYTIRAVHPEAFMFIEGDPHGEMPHWESNQPEGLVNATHWYDDITLVSKRHIPFFTMDVDTEKPILGKKNILKTFTRQVGRIREFSEHKLGGIPSLVGEFGIPYDMHRKKAYQTGDFSAQVRTLDTSYQVMEANLLSTALWNYCADNTNQRGDKWNDEDFSIFSRDQQHDPQDPDSGGRATKAFVRPYPMRIAGRLQKLAFDFRSGKFLFEFQDDQAVTQPTEIFLPDLQYPHGFSFKVSDGELLPCEMPQVWQYIPAERGGLHRIEVIRRPAAG